MTKTILDLTPEEWQELVDEGVITQEERNTATSFIGKLVGADDKKGAQYRMLCGCVVEQSAFAFDEEGFAVCATHKQRLYGWRSLPEKGVGSDFRYASYTPLELERYFIFGEPLPDKSLELEASSGGRDDFAGQELVDRANRLRSDSGGMREFPKLTDAIRHIEEGCCDDQRHRRVLE